MSKKALITGITGQDGSYLAEFLLEKGYEVHGIVREQTHHRDLKKNLNIGHIVSELSLHQCDIMDYRKIHSLILNIKPDETYHLAAQSHVGISFEDSLTFRLNYESTQHLLSSLKEEHPAGKFYFAATSEMFGQAIKFPQDENTPFNPVSPYAISKLAGFYITRMYRNAYNIFACSGILFNHESPRRGDGFVTRKITSTVAKIKLGLEKELRLGNIDVKRDWGYAKEYVQAIWLMLQQKKADDYVIGTGESHTIREFLEIAFNHVGLNWEKYAIKDPKFYRPAEICNVVANPLKAKEVLGWEPKVKFKELVSMMVDADLAALKRSLPK